MTATRSSSAAFTSPMTSKGSAVYPASTRSPLLGWLFKAEEEQRTKREILIFITPKVVPDGKGI